MSSKQRKEFAFAVVSKDTLDSIPKDQMTQLMYMSRLLTEAKDMFNNMPKDQMTQWMYTFWTLGVATAIRNTHTTNTKVLAKELYILKNGALTVKEFEDIVKCILPTMVKEKWFSINKGVATLKLAALMMVNDWECQLNAPQM
jgi:dihydroxyacetone kinase-like predicted kinase